MDIYRRPEKLAATFASSGKRGGSAQGSLRPARSLAGDSTKPNLNIA